MSDSRKAMFEAESEYSSLCKLFGEKEEGVFSAHHQLLEKFKKEEESLHRSHLQRLAARRQGLSKLTAEEKEALGIKS